MIVQSRRFIAVLLIVQRRTRLAVAHHSIAAWTGGKQAPA
jgi:hypothetical protein